MGTIWIWWRPVYWYRILRWDINTGPASSYTNWNYARTILNPHWSEMQMFSRLKMSTRVKGSTLCLPMKMTWIGWSARLAISRSAWKRWQSILEGMWNTGWKELHLDIQELSWALVAFIYQLHKCITMKIFLSNAPYYKTAIVNWAMYNPKTMETESIMLSKVLPNMPAKWLQLMDHLRPWTLPYQQLKFKNIFLSTVVCWSKANKIFWPVNTYNIHYF